MPLLLPLALLLGSCDGPGDPGAHPVGIAFYSPGGGTPVAQYVFPAGATGQLVVARGQTGTFLARLIDGNGNTLAIDGQEYSLQAPLIVISHLATAAILPPDRVEITAAAGGSPSNIWFSVEVHHGGHQEFTASGIPLSIQ